MDNVTHTLVGALLGETLARHTAKSLPLTERRRVFVPMLAIGSNLPDVDLLYTTVGQGRLEYLLHHRGHTHTIIGALALSLLVALLFEWRWRRHGYDPPRAERSALWCAASIGPLLHIAMDAMNSYGVHPFWPFDNRWYYGDVVFIVEPLYWAAAAPLVFLLRSWPARALVALTFPIGIALSIGTAMVPPLLLAIFAVLAAVMLYVGYRWPGRAAVAGVALAIAISSLFLLASQRTHERLQAVVSRVFPDDTVLDAMLTPMPINPLCWEVMLVQRANPQHFTVRRALLSLAPSWLPASSCPSRGVRLPTTAPLQAVAVPDSPELQWHGELTMPRATLAQLFHERCEARALLQFARIPWFAIRDSGIVLGDLRYDREAAPGFAEITLDAVQPTCPRWGAPWVPPRADLLR
jgi:inner membrane protein